MKLVDGRVKNYYIYKAQWIPDSPVETFTPYVEHLITSEKIKSSKIEALSVKYADKYGYKLPLFILKPILMKFEKKFYAEKSKNEWVFKIEEIPVHDFDKISQEFLTLYSQMVHGFIEFMRPAELNYVKAEEIINSFIEENNVSLTSSKFDLCESNSEMFKLSKYIKDLKDSNKPVFEFIMHLCEATLIKSYILNENCHEFSFSNKIIVIDTPIIIRALGYADEYLKEEYSFLLKCLLESKCKLEIFEHTFSEVYDILFSAKDWVESIDFDICKASDVCLYFRAKGYSKSDVIEEIEKLKDNINKLGISIIDESLVDWEAKKFVEDEKKIEENLKNGYNGIYVRERSIQVDVKSIMSIYLIRKNNKNKVLKDATHFFLTSNSVLAHVVAQYNSKHYPKTISPVATDMFIGMLACGENIGQTKTLVDNKILSYCYSGYKPTLAMKEKFMSIVESEKENLSDHNYILLKNHPLVCDALISSAEYDINNISEVTLWDVLSDVKTSMIFDTQTHYESLMKEMAVSTSSTITEKDLQIDALKREQAIERQKHIEELHFRNLQLAQREWEKWKRNAKYIKFATSVVAVLCIVASIIGGINFNHENKFFLIICIIGGVLTIILTPSSIISWVNNSKLTTMIYNKGKQKIARDYSVKAEEIV